MWRAIVLISFLCLAGCGERPASPFTNIDITGAEFGRSLLGLKDHHGQPRTLADYQGKVVLIFFGYTFCPDVCPTTLARISEVMKQLGSEADQVQVLFVTLDPERDTPDKLAAYVTWFYPGFVGLYGDEPATEAAAREFKVYYAKSKGSEGMGYAIDHSTGSYVLDSKGRLRLYLKENATVDAITADLKRLLADLRADVSIRTNTYL
jgi:protein SCO1/2